MDDSWLLPYADMLTLLLALFIVLFAMSELDAQRFKQLASIFQTEFSGGSGIIPDNKEMTDEDESEEDETQEQDKEEKNGADLDHIGSEDRDRLKEIQHEINDYIATNHLKDFLETILTDEGLLVTIRTDITFDSGSAKVKKVGQEIAQDVANFLVTDPPFEVVVSGHADDRPVNNDEFASNWELSAMRAIQFMYLLFENEALDPELFSAKGYGEYRPLEPNTNETNRALNRRVEVLIKPNYIAEQ